ncbi:MAG: chemotaxis protein [Candidatus Auribacterota bacterium]|jgi:two-component system chemotaxis response regulator CheV|nr:chemotaxis protein [Candidatus Auribacterota bacterium]
MDIKETVKRGNILLEAGTNELEIVEFTIDGCSYGINVAKVQTIIQYPQDIIVVPQAHPSLMGMINLRGNVISIINLGKHLDKRECQDKQNARVVVCEFNKIVVGFAVDSVTRIHRMSWKQIEAPTSIFSSDDNIIVAVAKIGEQIILLLDFEKITSDINPECGMQHTDETHFTAEKVEFNRADKTIYLAEDSTFIRTMILDYLTSAGYKTVWFSNGQAAWDKIQELRTLPDGKQIADHVGLLISDIEMPQMDGLHLIQNIKSDPKLKQLPCIIFSSLITEELAAKCQSVGADGQISKPEIEGLLDLVDTKVLK